MANIKYLFPKDNFPFISPPRHLFRHVSWPRVISPCCSAHPVPELRRHRARQREPAPLHGPRPGRGHQLQRTAGQLFFCNVQRVFSFYYHQQARRHLGDDFSQKIKMRSNTFVATVDSRSVGSGRMCLLS